MHFAATNIEQEVFVDGLALTRVKLVESTGQAAWLVGALASGGTFRILSALGELGRLWNS